MPLSEHEERILAEIERQLADEDPRFAARGRSRMGGPRLGGPVASWSPTVRLRVAIVLGVVGLACVLALAVHVAFAATGIALIFAAVLLGASGVRDRVQQQRTAVPEDPSTR